MQVKLIKPFSSTRFGKTYKVGTVFDIVALEGNMFITCLSDCSTLFYIPTYKCEVIQPAPEEHVELTDEVNHPSHYTGGKIECIDAIEASMSREEFMGFLKGQVIKYMWRYRHKGSPSQDLKKAEWYRERLENMVSEEVQNAKDK